MKTSSLQVFMLVLVTVFLWLISAWSLKEAAESEGLSLLALFIVVGVVVFVNAARFFIWGYIHKRYPISISYPLSSMFFPLILIMGYYYGEVISVNEIIGTALITTGVAIMTYKYSTD